MTADANATAELVLCETLHNGHAHAETNSSYALKVRRAMHYAGIAYTSNQKAAPREHRDVNPLGQVPVLLVGDEAVYDSSRIMARLVELRPDRLGIDPKRQAEALLWEELADTSLGSFLLAARVADDDNWPTVRAAFFAGMPSLMQKIVGGMVRGQLMKTLVARDFMRAGADECWRRFDEILDGLEARAPKRGYWMGDSACVADFALFGQLQSFRIPLTPKQGAAVEARSKLTAYLDRVDTASRQAAAGRLSVAA